MGSASWVPLDVNGGPDEPWANADPAEALTALLEAYERPARHADTILDTLRTGCATAAQHLTDAHAVLGDLALDDHHALPLLSPWQQVPGSSLS